MTDRELLELAARSVELARKAGADQAEAYLEVSRTFTGRVREGKTDLVKQATRKGLGVRVFVGGKVGFVSSSDLRPEALERVCRQAVVMAGVGERDEFAGLPAESGALPDPAPLRIYDPEIPKLSTAKKIDLALAAEAAARAADKRVTKVEGASFSNTLTTISIANSVGRTAQYQGTQANMGLQAFCAQGGGKSQSAGYFTAKRHFSELRSPEFVGRESARMAVERLNPVKLSTRKAPVLMHPDIAAGWLQDMAGAFSGDQVFKKASYLTEKLGQSIGSPLITIVDDGILPGGTSTTPFDGEGTPTRRNVLLEQGVVRTFLYDCYNARKAGKTPTGNAQRGYDSTPGIGTRNLMIQNGTTPVAELMRVFDSFFYMTDQGAFGYNAVTGDYSYQAAGLWVEKGEVQHAVDEITVASNTLDMLKRIVRVGDDLDLQGSVNAPHLLIEEMSIGGS